MTAREIRCYPTLALLVCVFLIAATGLGQAAPTGFPDVDVVLIAEVQDAPGWLALHHEVLSTPPGPPRCCVPRCRRVPAGAARIDIEQPRVTVGLVTTDGKAQVKVTVAGQLSPALALAMVTPFQQAAMEIQAGAVVNEIGLAYGLSGVAGRLLELYFDRP